MNSSMRSVWLVGVVAVVWASTAWAGYITFPNANESVATGVGLNTAVRDLPRTYQMQVAAGQLTGIDVGDLITGITWRLWTGAPASWPPTGGATWSDYEITLAQAANPLASMSTTFADNMVNPVQVRDGSLTIPEGAFLATSPGSPTPNPWGYEITFTPYAYQGGDLVILISHVGSGLEPEYLESVGSDGTVAVGRVASSFQASTGGSASITISRLTFEDAVIPEPATLPLVLGGLTALFLVVRRRAR